MEAGGAALCMDASSMQHLPLPLLGRAVEDFKRRAILRPQPYASSSAEPCQERFRIKRVCPKPAQVRRVRPQGRHPMRDSGGDVDTVVGVWRPRGPHLSDPSPGLKALGEQLGQLPPITRIAHGIQDSPPSRTVVRLIERAGPIPGVPEIDGDHDLRPMAAHAPRQRAPQRQAVLDDAVWLAQELYYLYPDHGGRRGLPCLPDYRSLCRRHGVDARLATGDQAVDDLFAL